MPVSLVTPRSRNTGQMYASKLSRSHAKHSAAFAQSWSLGFSSNGSLSYGSLMGCRAPGRSWGGPPRFGERIAPLVAAGTGVHAGVPVLALTEACPFAVRPVRHGFRPAIVRSVAHGVARAAIERRSRFLSDGSQ
jgi:hypothetical protein